MKNNNSKVRKSKPKKSNSVEADILESLGQFTKALESGKILKLLKRHYTWRNRLHEVTVS